MSVLAGLARRHWLFGLVLAGAVVLRVLAMLAFRPIMWFGGDSASYLATALRLVLDPSRAGGYGFVLLALRPLRSFAAVAAAQHLAGLAIGTGIYLLSRRRGLPAWAATLAAVPVLFDAYQLQLESDVLPDVAFELVVFVALLAVLWSPQERRPVVAGGAGLALGVSAILWPVGLALLAVLVVWLLVRWAGWRVMAAAVVAGAVPVLAYCSVFYASDHEFALTTSDGVFLWARTMSFADCAVVRPPAGERALCPPAGPRMAASLYVWSGDSPLLRLPGGRFSARTNALARDFALRAVAAQPGGYLAAVGHDAALSFYWDRPVHPDAGIVDRYSFADATTAWVPPDMRAPGGGTVASDQAAYAGRQPAPTRAVQPFASWLVSYQRYAYLRGTLLGVILLAGLAGILVRRRAAYGAGLAWAFAVTIVAVPPMVVDFDLRYLVPAVPAACVAAALAFAPRPADQRRCTTSPADTGISAADGTRTSSLPPGSTSAASPDSS